MSTPTTPVHIDLSDIEELIDEALELLLDGKPIPKEMQQSDARTAWLKEIDTFDSETQPAKGKA